MMAKRADLLPLTVLALIFILIYLPVWSAEYLYTDEAVQLWLYGKEPKFHMFIWQGRFITDVLFQWLFGSVQHVRQVSFIRLFSFVGWFATLPLWYGLLKKIVLQEGLDKRLAFLTSLFLICSPAVALSIGWASCLELFLANSCGFLSGWFLYNGLKTANNRTRIPPFSIFLSILFGLLSLFTYQNGVGFFFLPFIMQVLSPARKRHAVWISIGLYFFICAVYFVLFKYGLKVAGIAASERTGLHLAPWSKLRFFVTRPMSSAFHYTFLFNENDSTGFIVYALLFGAWLVLFLIRDKAAPAWQRLMITAIVLLLLVLTYLPSLLVHENYASNRTLLALGTAVWFLTAETVFRYLRIEKARWVFVALITVSFSWNAWYNITRLFLKPATHEYTQLRSYLEQRYTPALDTVYFIRPPEDFFVRQYGITRSWDEFGVPSTFFSWVPEFFVRQVVFEKTGDRARAQKLVIADLPSKQAFDSLFHNDTSGVLLVAAEEIMQQNP